LVQKNGGPNESQYLIRRWLWVRGRVDGVVRERLIEINAEKTDYTGLDAAADDLTGG
jgi:hypothetical protein